jgi:hypothetical protein
MHLRSGAAEESEADGAAEVILVEVRREPREKGNAGALALPQIALDIIEAQPEIDGNPYVFPGSLREAAAGHPR